MTLEERMQAASQVRAKGYNCAQTMLAAFPDILTLPADISLRLGTALGGGIGLTGNICGVVSGMAVLEGMRTDGSPAAKAATYKSVNALHARFAGEHGATLCPDLKARKIPCNDLIQSGIRIYYEHLREND